MIRTAFLLATVVWGQALPEYTVQVVASGMRYADGPAWSLEDFLLFSDTVTDKQHKFTPGKGVAEIGSRPGGTAGNAYDEKGNLYTCEFRERRVTRTAKNGKVEVIAGRFEGKRFNAPNDVVVRRDGNVYFTDPAFGNQEDTRELDFYGVFHVTTRGQLEAVAKWKTRPNGVALSANGRTLYVSDSDGQSIHAFDLDRAGAASNERVVVSKIPGVPAGLRTDEMGNIYVAAKDVMIYSPQGDLVRTIRIGETPSNLAFGDPDFSTLFVTARTSVYRIRLGVKGAVPYSP
ncbi:MAG TPA: SMP-30/gluconolactonase/LRE family protein [Bryobacteraceae bacterium]|nr:SMP-30/gluconolactonase/LRE family protein [Bryobacteraceae bacterium]